MPESLNTFDHLVNPILTRYFSSSYDEPMDQSDDSVRKGIGLRLKAARTARDMTQQAVADYFGVKKATVSAWEKGHGMPDAARLRSLSKLYKVSTDAILYEDSLSEEAMQFAAQFDALREDQQKMFRVLWLAYFEQAKSDDDVSKHMPLLPAPDKAHH